MTNDDPATLPAPTFAGGTRAITVSPIEWWAETRIPLGGPEAAGS